jgi:hypothetical protein
MARIKYTALVESIRGSIGGTTFQRNAYGYTVKSKPAIVNPQTRKQRNRKTGMQWAQNRWRSLSPTDRATWDTYATNYPVPSRLNPDAYLGGQQLFMRHEMLNYIWGGSDDVTTGDPSSITNPTGTLFLDSGSLVFSSQYDAIDGDFRVLCFAAPRMSITQNIVKSKCRYMGSAAVGGVPYNIDITDLYVSTYGSLPEIGAFVGAFFVFVAEENAAIIRTQPIYYEVMPV